MDDHTDGYSRIDLGLDLDAEITDALAVATAQPHQHTPATAHSAKIADHSDPTTP